MSRNRAEAAELGATIERVFAGMPRPALPSGWVDWLAERLASDRPAPVAAPPPLAAPSRDEMLPDKPVTGRALPAPLREETPSRNPKIDLALDASLREEALREKPGIDLTLDAPLREEALPEKPRDDLVLDAPPRDDVARLA